MANLTIVKRIIVALLGFASALFIVLGTIGIFLSDDVGFITTYKIIKNLESVDAQTQWFLLGVLISVVFGGGYGIRKLFLKK